MKFALRLGLSIALTVLLFVYVVDVHEVLRVLRNLQPAYVVLAFLVVTIDRVLMSYKWTVLLDAQGHRLPLVPALKIYCASMVWGLVLPATIGADAIRAVMATKRGFNGANVASSIVIERMVGFVLALALGNVSLLILRSLGVLDHAYDKALYLGVAILLGTIALLVMSMNEAFVDRALRALPRFIRESKVMHYLHRFAGAYHALGRERRAIARFAGLTVVEQVFSVTLSWVLALGLGVRVDLLLLLGVLPLSTLLSRLPISVDGLGVYEAIFVGLMLLAGISAEAALAIAISGRVVQLLAFLPWWLAQVIGSGALRPPQAPSKELPVG